MIDIHTCPECAVPLTYMVSVMTAANLGSPVERSCDGGATWSINPKPHWNWAECLYRIKRSTPEPFKAGDWVISIHPSRPYHIGKVVCVNPDCPPFHTSIVVDGITGAYRPDWFRKATDDEIAAHLKSQAHTFKVGDYVSSYATEARDGSRTAARTGRIHSIRGSDITIEETGFFTGPWPKHLLRAATDAEITAHKASQLASGHNPAKLTVSQVQDGWRLLDADEIKAHPICGIPVEYWADGWIGPCVSYANPKWSYRTKLSRAELAALECPKVPQTMRVPMRAEDFPPIFWIRFKNLQCNWLVTSIGPEALHIVSPLGTHVWRYDQLMDKGAQYSSDRSFWLSCSREVPV